MPAWPWVSRVTATAKDVPTTNGTTAPSGVPNVSEMALAWPVQRRRRRTKDSSEMQNAWVDPLFPGRISYKGKWDALEKGGKKSAIYVLWGEWLPRSVCGKENRKFLTLWGK